MAHKYKTIINKISKWEQELTTFQDNCSNKYAVKTHKSNTGNYDPSCDSYWTEFKCPDCGKFWVEDGSV